MSAPYASRRAMARRPESHQGTISRRRLALPGAPGESRGRSGPGGGGRGALFVVLLSVVMLAAVLFVARPAVAAVARGLAESNPAAMRFPFVAELVKQDLGDRLTKPASSDATRVRIRVPDGATADDVGDILAAQGLLKDRLAFDYLVITQDVGDKIRAGTYELTRNMSPAQVVQVLADVPLQTIKVALREGLRLEQITAYLATLGLEMDVANFYDLAKNPSQTLRKDYPFLSTLPDGRSLEGYLGSGTFEVYTDIKAETLLRMLLDQWGKQVGADPIAQAAKQGRTFYSVLALASIVEKEATLPQERPLIAGVYAKRAQRGMLLQADPTLYYGWDTIQLQKLGITAWPTYAFWTPIGRPLKQVDLTGDLAGYQTYRRVGMIPGPICTPSVGSIQAALHPDTSKGYLYFVAIPNGGGAHAFARTFAEHEANLRKYGYL